MPQPPDFLYDIFLSHNHADKPPERLKAAGVKPKAEGERMKAEVQIHPSSLILQPLHAGRRFIPLLLGDCVLPDTLRRFDSFRRDPHPDLRAGFVLPMAACPPNKPGEVCPVSTAHRRLN